jgi:hypothetical protein
MIEKGNVAAVSEQCCAPILAFKLHVSKIPDSLLSLLVKN